MSEFDPYTISTLMEKYDRDRDNLIEFHEFSDLFTALNAQYNEFLDYDTDSSGTMNGYELGNVLSRKGYTFSPDLFNYVVGEISRRSGRNGVTFDTYVRVIARFDFLRAQYNRLNNMQRSVSLENYMRNNFF
jgi:Ca2+-binding EF-hand superfamily protein